MTAAIKAEPFIVQATFEGTLCIAASHDCHEVLMDAYRTNGTVGVNYRGEMWSCHVVQVQMFEDQALGLCSYFEVKSI